MARTNLKVKRYDDGGDVDTGDGTWGDEGENDPNAGQNQSTDGQGDMQMPDGVQMSDDGSYTYTAGDGTVYTIDSDGNVVNTQTIDPETGTPVNIKDGSAYNPGAPETTIDPETGLPVAIKDGKATNVPSNTNGSSKPDATIWDKVKDKFSDGKGGTDWAKVIDGLSKGIGAGANLYGSIKGIRDLIQHPDGAPNPQQPTIPQMSFNRGLRALPAGNGKGLYLSGGSFTPKAAAGGYMADIQQQGQPQQMGQVQQVGGLPDPSQFANMSPPVGVGYAAGGGIRALGAPTHYLKGSTDGMADEVPAVIDGHQPARLAHGEFVWPADVVSHIGNGNSDAGAKKLYQAMANIRKARTGNSAQGKQINPDKFLPGMKTKKMAEGGVTDLVPRYADGGGVAAGNVSPYTTEQGVATWAQPYVTGMLGQTQAVAGDMTSHPENYVYQGPRAAGTSALQTQAYGMAGNLGSGTGSASAAMGQLNGLTDKLSNMPAYQASNVGSGYSTGPAYDVTKFSTDKFNTDAAKEYMNPYLQQSLDPQLAEARRQADITRMTNAGRLVGSGAFGGGRQAVMEAEGDRNLGTNLANITGQGYNTAYTGAVSQFNADQARKLQADQASEQSKQFGTSSGMQDRSNAANYGLQAAGINENSRQAGARMGIDSLSAAVNSANGAGTLGLGISNSNRADANTVFGMGNQQQATEQAGLTANMNQFNEEAALPTKALGLQHDMLTGLPISAQTVNTPGTSLAESLRALGMSEADIAKLMGTP